jgi:hypothetical protein
MASPAFKPEPGTLPVAEDKVCEQARAENCEERLALLGKYNIAGSFSAQCSSELHSKDGGGCSKIELEQIRHRAVDAKDQLNVAFDRLEQHVTEHGCRSERSHHLSDYHVAPDETPENSQ